MWLLNSAYLNQNHVELSDIGLFFYEGLFIWRNLDNDIAYKVSYSWTDLIELIIVLPKEESDCIRLTASTFCREDFPASLNKLFKDSKSEELLSLLKNSHFRFE